MWPSALRKQGKVKEAISEYEQALNIAPEDSAALNNLAWILATSSDASMRDGARAVTLATRAVQVSGGRNPSFVRTLAAAQRRGRTIRRSRRDSGGSKGISQHAE